MLSSLKGAPKYVKLLAIDQFFEGFVPITALYVLIFDRAGGVSFEQISILFAVWSLAYLIAELPSGVLADYWSRRNVKILGSVLRGLGFCFWLFYPGFWGYFIGFVLWGFMIACSSGATSALLRSELEADKKEKLFTKYYGRTLAALSVGALTGYVLAAVLTVDNANTLLGISIASSFLGALTLCFIKEREYKRQSSYIRTLLSGLEEFKHSRTLRYIGFILFSVFTVYGVLEEFVPRIYAEVGLSDSAIALVIALTYVVSITLLFRLEKYAQVSMRKQVLGMAVAVAAFAVGLVFMSYATVAFLLFFGFALELARSLFQNHIQTHVKGDEKATIASIPGLAGGLSGAVAYVIISWLSQWLGSIEAMQIYAVAWVVVLVLFALKKSPA